MEFQTRKVIAVDVDGTLYIGGEIQRSVICFLTQKKLEGFSIFLWSAAGERHAREIAKRFQIEHLFDHILSKPGYILDDDGWRWIAATKELKL